MKREVQTINRAESRRLKKRDSHFEAWNAQIRSDDGVGKDHSVLHLHQASFNQVDKLPDEIKYDPKYQAALFETFVDIIAPNWNGKRHTYIVREYDPELGKFSPKTKLMPLYDKDGSVLIPELPVAVEIYRKNKLTGEFEAKVLAFDFDAKKASGVFGMMKAHNEAMAMAQIFLRIGFSNLAIDQSNGGYHVIVPLAQWKTRTEIRRTLDTIFKSVYWETLDTTVMASAKSCITIPGSPNKDGHGFRILMHSDFVEHNPLVTIGATGKPELLLYKDILTMAGSRSILTEVRNKMGDIKKLRDRPRDSASSLDEYRAIELESHSRTLRNFRVKRSVWDGYNAKSGTSLGGMKRTEFIEKVLRSAAKQDDNSVARMAISTMVYKISNGIFDLFERKLKSTDPSDKVDYCWMDRFKGESEEDVDRHIKIEFAKASSYAKGHWEHTGAYLTDQERAEFGVAGRSISAAVDPAITPVATEIQKSKHKLPTAELRRGMAWDLRMNREKHNGSFVGVRYTSDKEIIEGFYRAASQVHRSEISDFTAPFAMSVSFLSTFSGWQLNSVYNKVYDASLPFCRRREDGTAEYYAKSKYNDEGQFIKEKYQVHEYSNIAMPTDDNFEDAVSEARSNLHSLQRRSEFISAVVAEGVNEASNRLMDIVDHSNFHEDNILGKDRKPRRQQLVFLDYEFKKPISLPEAKALVSDAIDGSTFREVVEFLLEENVLNAAEIEEAVSLAVRNSNFSQSLFDDAFEMAEDYREELKVNAKRSGTTDFMIEDKVVKFEQIAEEMRRSLMGIVTEAISKTIAAACFENANDDIERGFYFIEQKADYDNSGVSRIFRSPLHEKNQLSLASALQAGAVLMSQTTVHDGYLDEDNLKAIRLIRDTNERIDLSHDQAEFQQSSDRTSVAQMILEQETGAVVQFLETFYQFKVQRYNAFKLADCEYVEGERRVPITTFSQMHTGRQLHDVKAGEKISEVLEYTSLWTYLSPPDWFTEEADLDHDHVEPLWSQHNKKQGLSTMHRDVYHFLCGEKTFQNSFGEIIEYNEDHFDNFTGFITDKDSDTGISVKDLSNALRISHRVLRGIINDLERVGLIDSTREKVGTQKAIVFRSLSAQRSFRNIKPKNMDEFWEEYHESHPDSYGIRTKTFDREDGERNIEMEGRGDFNPDFPISVSNFKSRKSSWVNIEGSENWFDHSVVNTEVDVTQRRYRAVDITNVNLPFLFQQTRSWHAYLNSNDLRSTLRFATTTRTGADRVENFIEKSKRLGISMQDFDYLANSFLDLGDPESKESDAVQDYYDKSLRKSNGILAAHLPKTPNLQTFANLTRGISRTKKFKKSREIKSQIEVTMAINGFWNSSLLGQFDTTEVFDQVLDSKLNEYVNSLDVQTDDIDYEHLEYKVFGKYRLFWFTAGNISRFEYWTNWMISSPEERDQDAAFQSALFRDNQWTHERVRAYEDALEAQKALELAA